jgi:hypothetical protein
LNLLENIRQDYELCINNSEEYIKKVDSISTLLGLKGKYRLISDTCPVYLVGKYNVTPFIFFGINPGHSDTNSPIEDKDARTSWKRYEDLYQNFFSYFEKKGFESPYYTILWHFIDGLRFVIGDSPIVGKWKLFEKYITNVELIPYHSRGIAFPSKLSNLQLDYLVRRFEDNLNFIINCQPKLFIFNGSPWYLLLIKNKLISDFEKIPITNKFNVYFFKIKDMPSVLFDKFFQRHFWGITNEHRRTIIPNMIAEKFPSILSK